MARLRSSTATSAGGIVVRNDPEGPSLVVGMRRRERSAVTWTLPKGTPDRGETTEQTALREVAEETGLEVRIVDALPSIEYSFVQDGIRIHKTVHYFLMEATGGDLERHDHEFERVRWVSFADAPALLTFETERGLVATAGERVRARAQERAVHEAQSPAGATAPAVAAPAAAAVGAPRAAVAGTPARASAEATGGTR